MAVTTVSNSVCNFPHGNCVHNMAGTYARANGLKVVPMPQRHNGARAATTGQPCRKRHKLNLISQHADLRQSINQSIKTGDTEYRRWTAVTEWQRHLSGVPPTTLITTPRVAQYRAVYDDKCTTKQAWNRSDIPTHAVHAKCCRGHKTARHWTSVRGPHLP